MALDVLLPVEDLSLAHAALQSDLSLGQRIKKHSKHDGLPSLEGCRLAILGVLEGRGAVDNVGTGKDLDQIRKYLYQMFPGNWHHQMVDLGNIQQGKELSDTYYALKEVCHVLIKQDILPIVIGGSQDLTYAMYRAFDAFEKPVNVVAVDNRFDLGELGPRINSYNFLHHMIMDKPNNLFNFSNLGFQTFFNSQEEIDLMDKLFFEAYRLGELSHDLTHIEPVMRDADLVSIDLSAVRMGDAPANNNAVPNGFYGDQICALSRYAGISRKVAAFGIFEFNSRYDHREQSAHLIAQMIWYFIEGFNLRIDEFPFESKDNYKKYIVPVEKETLIFYKSDKSERWWLEIQYDHNNSTKSTLIPCTYQDYLLASDQIFPERWLKTFRKLN